MSVLRFGSTHYDQFDALTDGRVRVDGCDLEHQVAPIATDVFRGVLAEGRLDVAELGLTYYLRSLEAPDPPVVALPVFPARAFRHSAVFVNTAAGIRGPADLAGKTVGEFLLYGHDAGVWAKGLLGLDPARSRWVVGGLERPVGPIDYVPRKHPDGVEVELAAPGADLGELLDRGEIDALISGNVPACVRAGSPRVARLFPDYREVERAWFRGAGFVPPMHVVVVRRSVLAAAPALARALYDAFTASKALARRSLELRRITNFVDVMVPWVNDLVEQNAELNRAVDAGDWWPYGLAANRPAIQAFLRYHAEQGLSRRWDAEEIFAPALLDT